MDYVVLAASLPAHTNLRRALGGSIPGTERRRYFE